MWLDVSLWTINPTSILEARLGIDYTLGGKTPSTLGDPIAGLTIPGEPTGPGLGGGLISSSLSGFTSLGRQSSNPQYQDPFVGDPKVNYTKVVGRHTVKVGFEYQLIDTAVSDFHPQYGTETFHGILQRSFLCVRPIVGEQSEHQREGGL